MSEQSTSFARFIALRYVSAGKQSHLVSFMSALSIFGLALGIAILIIVLSVMNGFDREMRENILGIVPHLTLSYLFFFVNLVKLLNLFPRVLS